MIHSGIGYTMPPTITISGGGGSGAVATCEVETIKNGIVKFDMINNGSAYKSKPTVAISGSVGTGQTAVGIASISNDNQISAILIQNSGIGYTQSPTITLSAPSIISGSGSYKFNETVVGSNSGTVGRVKYWDIDTKILKVSIVNNAATKGFYPGEIIVGSASSATYAVSTYDTFDNYDKYGENKVIQIESEDIVDTSESSPFGFY